MTLRARETTVEADVRVLLLTLGGHDGEKRVTLPRGAVVTFGPAIPGNDKGEYQRREYALRIYDGPIAKNNLIAVFTGVREFRNATMKVEKLIVREAGKAVWKSNESGFKVEEEVKRTEAWADPLHQLEEGGPF